MEFKVEDFKYDFNENEENYVLVVYSSDDSKHKHPYYVGYSMVVDRYLLFGSINKANIFDSLREIKNFIKFWLNPNTEFYDRICNDGFDPTNIYIVELKPSITHRIVFED